MFQLTKSTRNGLSALSLGFISMGACALEAMSEDDLSSINAQGVGLIIDEAWFHSDRDDPFTIVASADNGGVDAALTLDRFYAVRAGGPKDPTSANAANSGATLGTFADPFRLDSIDDGVNPAYLRFSAPDSINSSDLLDIGFRARLDADITTPGNDDFLFIGAHGLSMAGSDMTLWGTSGVGLSLAGNIRLSMDKLVLNARQDAAGFAIQPGSSGDDGQGAWTMSGCPAGGCRYYEPVHDGQTRITNGFFGIGAEDRDYFRWIDSGNINSNIGERVEIYAPLGLFAAQPVTIQSLENGHFQIEIKPVGSIVEVLEDEDGPGHDAYRIQRPTDSVIADIYAQPTDYFRSGNANFGGYNAGWTEISGIQVQYLRIATKDLP